MNPGDMAPPEPTSAFLDWNKPALDQAVAFLTREWQGGPLDLRDTLIIVPTRHAGRRLRERLALAAAERNSAVLVGTIETPASLFAPTPAGRPLTDAISSQALWQSTLSTVPPASLTALFPSPPPDNAFSRAANAEHLARLRALLTEEGHTLTSFAREFGNRNPEPERWQCLATLEIEYLRQADKAGLRDDATAKITAAHRPELPGHVRRVLVLFVPDPPPLAITALSSLAAKLPVTTCVHAPESASGDFDKWGRPIPERWERTPRPLRDCDIEQCEDVAAMVEQIRRHVSGLPGSQRGDLTIGVGTPDTAARLRLALDGDNVPVFDPGGSPASGLPVFQLLRRLFALHREPTFEAFMAFARTPEVLRRLESGSSRHNLLELLDDFQAQHIPATFDEARSLADRDESAKPVASALAETAEVLRMLDAGPLARSLPALLSRLYQDQTATADLVTGAEALNAILDRFARVEPLCANRQRALLLFESAIASAEIRADRQPDSVDLLGWLELAWEDAPAMLLADMNDGLIPDAVTSDPFLPDNARKTMNLRDNRMRLARDAYTLETVLRSRQQGNARLFVPRRNSRGDPLKPSRLLFQCPDSDLARRTLHLLADSPSPLAAPKRSRGWPVRPPLPDELPPVTRVSVTALRDYLACPFMFYLKNTVRMEPVEPAAELDAMTFGTVAHEALDSFASGDLRDSGDPALIEQILHGAVNRIFRERHGDRLPLPLFIQRNLLLQRMTYAAKVQAALRAGGWRILCGERKFELALGDLRLSGRVDRIDQHTDGRMRVIDYKTAGRGDKPESQHLAKVTARTNVQPWALTCDGKQRWKDLQLPLYRFWCAREHASANVECAYFVLPDAVSKTAVHTWNGLDDAVVADAWRCAGEIAARITAGVFWPPRNDLRRDDPFRRIFFEDIVASLAPDFVEAMAGRKV